MSAATTYGFVADPGTQQTEGALPVITQRLNELAKELHVTIYGLSGFRTPAQSVAVGGYANDPHTQGLAEDIGVDSQLRSSAGQITNQQLASVGLQRPFDETGQDPTELNHIQLAPTPANRTAIAQAASEHSAASDPVHQAVDTAGQVVNDATHPEQTILGYVEPKLEQGVLYFALIVGGVALAGYGLVRMLEPTGLPQAVGGVARKTAEAGAEA